MFRPSVRGSVWAVEETEREWIDRTTDRRKSYKVRMVDLLMSNPRGQVRVRVLGDAPLPEWVRQDAEVEFPLAEYKVENNQPVVSVILEGAREIV